MARPKVRPRNGSSLPKLRYLPHCPTDDQPTAAAGLTATQVPHLKLKWAFGMPNATSAFTEPTVIGGRIYISSNAGVVYALKADTGCVYWSFKARSGVRSAIIMGPAIKDSKSSRYP